VIVHPREVDAAIARTILLRSFPAEASASPRRVEATLDFVEDRVGDCSTIMRLGVRVIAVALGAVVRLVDGVSIGTDPPEVVRNALSRWMERPLPALAEYVRLVRSLTLVGWFDSPMTAS
jgi:hypothetical protein